MKQRFIDPRQKLSQHFLCNSVAHRWDTQWTRFTLAFGNEHATQRFRLECVPSFEFMHRGVEVLIEMSLEHLDADLIDPSSTPDSTYLAPPSPSVTLGRWLRTPPKGEFE